MTDAHKHFQNRACPYFPCHAGADPATFNCLFCYCPLYWFEDCGGDCARLGPIKDCSRCLKPHSPGGWEHVQTRLKERFRRLRAQETEPAEAGEPPSPDKT